MSVIRSRGVAALVALLAGALVVALLLAPGASAAPLLGSNFDSGDGNQDTQLSGDWQSAYAQGRVKISRDRNDDCFIGGVKENTPDGWAFNNSAGGCTPGKSNVRVAYVNPETTAAASFSHFAFYRNDTTGNTFLTFELNQARTAWTNSTGTTIPCRSNGDILLSFEVGGSSLQSILYRWTGDGNGPPTCPNGANGTFMGSGVIPGGRSQGTMNSVQATANHVDPASLGALFPANSFGEAAIDIPAVLQSMGQSPCMAYLQMQVHSRSSSSISSAMIDYTEPVPVHIQSCAAIGEKYADVNANGLRDAGENGLAGFEFYVDADDDGVRDAGEPTGTSDASGFYRILGVSAGLHKVREVAKPGWRISAPASGFQQRVITAGGNAIDNDFGNVGPATATGTRFHDVNANGVRDAAELGLAGWTYYADLDDDGVKGAGEPSGISDANGAWTIENVRAGSHTIREVPQAGWNCSAPVGCAHARTFTSGETVSGLEFGGWTAASVAGNVFEDADGDGAAQETGDMTLAVWQVYLDANSNNGWDFGEIQTSTGVSGDYTLIGVAPGAHTVRVTSPPAGWYCTRPGTTTNACERTVTLTSGQLSGGRDFGFSRTATVSGTVFNDADNSGTRGGAETAWTSATTIYADLDANGAPDAGEPSVSTSTGTWALTGIPAGSIAIRQAGGAFTCTTPAGCAFTLTPTSGQTLPSHEFGNYVSTAKGISGTIWLDANANGVKDVSETTGVSGITVYADNDRSDTFTPGDTTAVTNAVGAYAVTLTANGNAGVGIKPGTYGVYACSYPSGCFVTINGLGNGASSAGNDFGVSGPASVSGKLVHDLNANGVRDAGETGALAGRTIYVDANSNLAFDSATEKNTTSAADGTYILSGLLPGPHTIRMVTGAGYTCSAPSTCSYSVQAAGAAISGRDFLNWTTAIVTGTLSEDADADGAALEAGEVALANRTVYLDANNNSAKDVTEISVLSDVDGIYTFGAVGPGSHTVRQVLPDGWVHDTPADGHIIAAVSGGSYDARDFSSHTTAAISGRLFDDADFQGDPFETGDSGLDEQTVYLDANDNGQLDGGETTATTNALGNYTLTVAPGSYTVRPVPANPDRACASPSGCAYTITATSGGSYASRDFGSYVGATVSGTVFEDADADGQAREPGETPAQGRRVYLDADANGVRAASEPTKLTAADGSYSFRGVTAQSWGVRLDLAGGWTCDSPSLPCAYSVVLTSAATQPGKDFGVHTTATVSGHLYTDRDNDGGSQTFGENDQPGRTVVLDANGPLDGGDTLMVTDDLGDYSFANLQPGTYEIRQVLPAGWQASVPATGMRTVTVASGETEADQDFSSWTTSVITGRVFEDADADGEFPEAGEPGTPLRTVYLDNNASGSFDGGDPSVVTGAGGSFEFSGLAPGTYTARPVSPDATWTCSYPASCSVQMVVEAGEVAQEIDFGLWTTGTLTGTVFEDSDGDGDRDGGEGALVNRIVFVDIDGDTNKGDSEPSQATDSDGGYAFDLEPGTYTVRQSPVAGWVCTTTPCTRTATISSDQTVDELDFANRLNAATVSGTVFDDADADGAAREGGETARAGRTVFDDVNGSFGADAGEPQTISGADGSYTLTLAAGVQHTIRVEEAARTVSHPAAREYAINPAIAQVLPGRDFGSWAAATISGRWWDDRDGDGMLGEAGEGGHGPRTVYLDLDGDGTLGDDEPTAITQPDGSFSFAGLKPGEYVVRADLPANHVCSVCSATITVISGGDPAGVDVASYGRPTLSGRVVVDANADGIIDAGDQPRANVVVYVDADDSGTKQDGETSATTADDGSYSLTLQPGTRVVRIQSPASFVCSHPAADCRHSDELLGGDAITGRDFAIHEPATIAGVVRQDSDADGSGDAPLGGRKVYVDLDGSGTRNDGEPATTTADDGSYSFDGLRPGAYTVRLELPDGWTCSAPTPCRRDETLTSGEQASVGDFAVWQTARLAGVVREDADADGGADAPLAGQLVYLDTDGDDVRDDGEPTRTSGDGGSYEFTGLKPGARTVRLDPAANATCSAPASCERAASLGSGQDLTGQDFAVWQDASVSGTLREDTDADGTGDGQPLAGRTVYLDLDGSDSHNGSEPTRTTADDGSYSFDGLRPGAYTVGLSLGGGATCSTPDPCERTLELSSGEQAAGSDFAVWTAATISGTVFEDADGDGQVEGGGPLAGQTLYLDLDDSGTRADTEPAQVTDDDGGYAFTVVPGRYTIRADVDDGWTCSAPDPCRHEPTVSSAQTAAKLDFALFQGAQVSGTLTEDSDADGETEAGDGPLAGQTVYLDTNGNERRDDAEASRTTDTDGTYAFGVLPGTHAVRVEPSAGWTLSAPAAGGHTATLSSGQRLTGRDFAAWKVARIAGTVIDDSDRDGIADAGEKPLAGAVVYLDADDDGTLGAGEPSRTTGDDGSYAFVDLRPRSRSVRLADTAGRTCTAPADCRRDVVLTSGAQRSGQDFLSHRIPPAPDPTPEPTPDPAPQATPPTEPAGTVVSGILFEDRDADGLAREARENALAGRMVYVDANANGQHDGGEAATVTSAQGAYSFVGLAAGRHRLRTIMPDDKWVCSMPADCTRELTLSAGQHVEVQDFGSWRKVLLEGRKFRDADRDGSSFEAGDQPLAGWVVYVDLNANGRRDDGEPYDITDENGRYGITSIQLGTHKIRSVSPAGSGDRCSFPASCVYSITFASSDEAKIADFGAVLSAQAQLNKVRVFVPSSCRTRAFTISVASAGARKVVLRVDGSPWGTDTRPDVKRRFSFRMVPSRYTPGVHTLTFKIAYADGSVAVKKATFYRCRSAKPSYTG